MATLNFGPNTGPTYLVFNKSDEKIVFEGNLTAINAWRYEKSDDWSCLIMTPREYLKNKFDILPDAVASIAERDEFEFDAVEDILDVQADVSALRISWEDKCWICNDRFYNLDKFNLESALETELHGAGLGLVEI